MTSDRAPRRVAHRLVAATAVLLLAGCGVPRPGTTTTFDPDEVPYGLLVPNSADVSPAATPNATPGESPQVWLVQDATLVPTEAEVPPEGTPRQQAEELLDRLGDGPSSTQRASGLSTSLVSGVKFSIKEVVGTEATVELTVPSDRAPSTVEAPRAIGQIVMTVTSVPGIDTVVFDDGTDRLEVPLPGGALTDQPVDERDYASLRN